MMVLSWSHAWLGPARRSEPGPAGHPTQTAAALTLGQGTVHDRREVWRDLLEPCLPKAVLEL